MVKTKKVKNKQTVVTVVTANYVDMLLPGLLEKSIEAYSKIDFSKKHFQVSVYENTHATAGIVLTLLAIEAYRNRIFYLDNKRLGKSGLADDLSKMFKAKDGSFPEQQFKDILTELVIVRDVIVHNHLYEVDIFNDGDWEMISHRQKLLADYGDGKRLRSGLVTEQTRQTKTLKLNVQPAKIGFEDLFTVLVIFDMFVGISNKLLSNSYVPFHFTHNFNEEWIDRLSHLLSHHYVNNISEARRKRLKKIYEKVRKDFDLFIPEHRDYFLKTVCPKCQDFGFHQPFKVYACPSCKFEIKVHSGYVKK